MTSGNDIELKIPAAFYIDPSTGRDVVIDVEDLAGLSSTHIAELRRNHPLHCGYCGQRVVLSHSVRGRPCYKHASGYDRGSCISELTTNPLDLQRTRRYGGRQEGPEHRHAVDRILHFLRRTPGHGPIGKEITLSHGDQRRRPDILVTVGAHQIAIEVQISYEYPAVMADRARFYAALGIHLIYVWSPFSAIHITGLDDAALTGGCQFLWDTAAEVRSQQLQQLALSWRWMDHAVTRENLDSQPVVTGVTPFQLLLPTRGTYLNPAPTLRPPVSPLARNMQLTTDSDWQALPKRFRKWHENGVRSGHYPDVRPESLPARLITEICRLEVLLGLHYSSRWSSPELAAMGAVSTNTSPHSGAFMTLALALALDQAGHLPLTQKQRARAREAMEKFRPGAEALPGDLALLRAHLARLAPSLGPL